MKNLKGMWDKSPELVDGVSGERLADSGFEEDQPDEEFDGAQPGAESQE